LNSRERVLLALNHREPDRIPLDFGGTYATGITAIAYNRLKRYLGINEGETRLSEEMTMQLAEPESNVLQLARSDCVRAGRTLPPAGPSEMEWKSWTLPDGSPAKVSAAFSAVFGLLGVRPSTRGTVQLLADGKGGWILKDGNLVRVVMPKGALFFEDAYHPLEKAESKKDVDAFFEGSYDSNRRWPPIMSKADAEALGARTKFLFENTDYAITVAFGTGIFEGGMYLRGFMNYLTDIARNKDLVIHMGEKLVEYYKTNLEICLGAVKEYAQVALVGDDVAGQQGPLLSPKVYRELIKPYEREVISYIKKNSSLFVNFHCCGSAYGVLPDLIDIGVDILNPVQVSAKDMEPAKLKKDFGEEMVFWGGGVDAQRILGTGKPDDVIRNARQNIEAFAPGGGFVFAPAHNIMANVPPENIVAMLEAAKEYGDYGQISPN